MNERKYLQEAKRRGIENYTVFFDQNRSQSLTMVDGEVREQQIADETSLSATGLFRGKVGSYRVDSVRGETPSLLAEGVLRSALNGRRKSGKAFLSERLSYPRNVLFDPAFPPLTLKELGELARRFDGKIRAEEPRAEKILIEVSTEEGMEVFFNSHGIVLKTPYRFLSASAQFIRSRSTDRRAGGLFVSSLKGPSDLEERFLAKMKEAVQRTEDLLGSRPSPSGEFPVLLSPDAFLVFLRLFLSQLSAKAVQDRLSLLCGRKGRKVSSCVLSVDHTPMRPSPFAMPYDGDGVPVQDFPILERGILRNYADNLETAGKAHRKSNGCSTGSSCRFGSVTVHPGTRSMPELLSSMEDGLLVTSLGGLNSGIDGTTLHFSLPFEGYRVQGGRRGPAVSMNLLSGDVLSLMEDLVEFSSETEESPSGDLVPFALVRRMAISGTDC